VLIGVYLISTENQLDDLSISQRKKLKILKKNDQFIFKHFKSEYVYEYMKSNPNMTTEEINENIAGKPFEKFFETLGKPLIEKIVDEEDIDIVNDLSSNPLIPVDEQKWCAIDNFSYNSITNIGAINEMKDFDIDMNDKDDPNAYVAIQSTKLLGIELNGENIYDIIFYKDAVDGKYYPYTVNFENKKITTNKISNADIDLKSYNIITTSSIGIVYCNLLDIINNSENNFNNKITMEKYEKYPKFYRCKIGEVTKDKIYGKIKKSIRIPKYLFHK
jgi:hypothetical protein